MFMYMPVWMCMGKCDLCGSEDLGENTICLLRGDSDLYSTALVLFTDDDRK